LFPLLAFAGQARAAEDRHPYSLKCLEVNGAGVGGGRLDRTTSEVQDDSGQESVSFVQRRSKGKVLHEILDGFRSSPKASVAPVAWQRVANTSNEADFTRMRRPSIARSLELIATTATVGSSGASSPVLGFFAEVFAIAVLVVCLSSSDFIVLTPFFTGPSKYRFACCYVVTMFSIWLCALFVVFGVRWCGAEGVDTIEIIARRCALLLIALMSLKFFHEWLYEKVDNVTTVEDAEDENPRRDPITYCRLIYLILAVNCDDYTVFSTGMLNNVMRPIPLCLGTLLAATFVSVSMLWLSQIGFIRRVCTSIPTFVIFSGLFVYMMISEFQPQRSILWKNFSQFWQ